jgi:hypothetical protein
MLVLATCGFVWYYGLNVPYWDEWDGIVPAVTGEQPVTFAWLWSQYNEQRLFLPRLILLAAYKLSGYDFRAGMFINVAVLGALAAAMILTARKLRGRTSFTDMFFPLTLLNWGQAETLLMSMLVQYVTSTLLASIVLLIMVRKESPAKFGTAILAGACVVLLPLCGANGLALVPALAIWLCAFALRSWYSQQRCGRGSGLIMVAFACAGFLFTGLYFRAFKGPDANVKKPTLETALTTCGEFLSTAFVPQAWSSWPWLAFLAVVLSLSGAATLVAVWYRQPQQRFQSVGLLLFLAGMACLVVGLGWGRAGIGQGIGLSHRYATLLLPWSCCLYFVWTICYPRTLGRLGQVTLWLIACTMFLPNVREGLSYAKGRRLQMVEFEREVRAGKSIPWLAKQFTHGELAIFHHEQHLAKQLRRLHKAGIGVFRSLHVGPSEADADMLVGAVDMVDSTTVAGWACKTDQTSRCIEVDIFDGDKFLATVPADRFRPDLADLGDGNHGFDYRIPFRIRDGWPHTIRVTFAGTDIDLGGSPKVVSIKGP